MRAEGFSPVFDGNSKLLILGSFPSVMSRKTGFYYGNPQNRFWRTVCGFFGEEVHTVSEKRVFLLRRGIALWDVVLSCDIVGSADADIRDAAVADIPALMEKTGIGAIFCNGKRAFSLLEEHFPQLLPLTRLLPSTSPANPRFSAEVWRAALDEVFGGERSADGTFGSGKIFQNG